MEDKKYSHSKVYKLVYEDKYYIGSTINDLRFRLSGHKNNSKTSPEQKVYKYFNEVGWDDVKIILIEAFVCNNRDELRMKEDEYIQKAKDDENCLNYKRAFISTAEEKVIQGEEKLKLKNERFEKLNTDCENNKKIKDEEAKESLKQTIENYEQKNGKKVDQDVIDKGIKLLERTRAKMRKSYQVHKEERIQMTREWREAHPDYTKNYYEQNKAEILLKRRENYKLKKQNKEAIKT